eukprot:TRINITY_DN66527_c6_g10_i1.p1 TRINITY_DN66527_c6_g10~~TRINITY_DN66527_c6_g10_i1.p1  ORF type:complete len:119 (+),score=10.67 TRINITY_DN66527_c6_g10_i1:118-474(+)
MYLSMKLVVCTTGVDLLADSVASEQLGLLIELTLTVLLVTDLLLNFVVAYKNKHGEAVTSPPLICVRYLQSWFLPDVLASVPWSLIPPFGLLQATLFDLTKLCKLRNLRSPPCLCARH